MNQRTEFVITDLESLDKVILFLRPYFKSNTIFLFYGEMASGKTTLISKILQSFNIFNASSPTYAIHQSYAAHQLMIHHFDLHRIQSQAELESVGFWDFFSVQDDLFLVEWADRIPKNHWPMSSRIIKIEIKINKTNHHRSVFVEI